MIKKIFNITLYTILIIFIFLSIVSSIVVIDKIQVFSNKYLNVTIIYFILTFLVLIFMLLKIDIKNKISIIFFIGIIIRIIWTCYIQSKLVSDYLTIYNTANEFLLGDITGLRGYNYLSRFPHLIPMMLYMSCIIYLFGSYNIVVFKIINILLSGISMILIIKLSKYFLKNEKSKVIVCFLSAINIPSICYVSTYCTENVAIPLYLFTILIFFKTLELNKNRSQYIGLIFTGIMLYISNLFRCVGIVFLLAFSIYLIFYTKDTKNKKIINVSLIILAYLLISMVISYSLIGLGIIERPLWKGTEPKITSVLKGSNISSFGRWNQQDADFISANLQNKKLEQMCNEKIIQRISNISIYDFIKFLICKYAVLWSFNDCGGIMWATNNLNDSTILLKEFQIFGIVIVILSFLSIYRENTQQTKLTYLLFVGITCFFILLEVQPRYSYIISWVFIFMAAQEIEYICQKYNISI